MALTILTIPKHCSPRAEQGIVSQGVNQTTIILFYGFPNKGGEACKIVGVDDVRSFSFQNLVDRAGHQEISGIKAMPHYLGQWICIGGIKWPIEVSERQVVDSNSVDHFTVACLLRGQTSNCNVMSGIDKCLGQILH